MLTLFATAVLQVLAICIVVGGGLPALFAVGVRWMAAGAGGDAEVMHEKAHPAFKVLAYLCFAIVFAVVALALAIIISSGFGYTVTFDHVLPMFARKGH